jgi:hypothetical protein
MHALCLCLAVLLGLNTRIYPFARSGSVDQTAMELNILFNEMELKQLVTV